MKCEHGIEEQRKTKSDDEQGRVMRVSDVLKNPTSDELPFIGFMPENLPFKIDEGTKKKNDTPQNNDY